MSMENLTPSNSRSGKSVFYRLLNLLHSPAKNVHQRSDAGGSSAAKNSALKSAKAEVSQPDILPPEAIGSPAAHAETNLECRQAGSHSDMVFNCIGDLVFTADKNLVIADMSPSIEKHLGYKPSDLLGKRLARLTIFSAYSLKMVLQQAEKVFQTGQTDIGIFECRTRNGTTKMMEITGSLGYLNREPYIVYIGRDATERYRNDEELQEYYREVIELNEKLNESQQQLNELINSKNKFFSILSHDLKSPFSSLLGYSDFLMTDLDSLSKDEIRQFAEGINNSSRYLYKLVDNLLQWSLVQTGQMEYDPIRLDLAEIVNSNLLILGGNALRKNINIINRLQDTEVTAMADHNTINSVIMNLLSNAIKFTEPGGIIEISAHAEGEHVRISIRDNGIGIPEQDLQKLFRIDIRHSTKGTSKEKGTGLGLILCKELVENNGGQISVESTPGRGSTFSFTLPCA